MKHSRRFVEALKIVSLLALQPGVSAWVNPQIPQCQSPQSTTSINNENVPDWLQLGRQWVAAVSLAGVLMLSPNHDNNAVHSFWTPAPCYAAEEVAQSDEQQEPGTVLNEVWTLIDKYFIDRTFGGQDWSKIYDKYSPKVAKVMDDDAKTMKYVTEMVSLLGDKYSRILDVNQYAAIQKFDLIGVGVTLMPNQNKQIIVGSPPIPKSASDLAGLKVGDRVVAINGVPTEGRTAFDIIDQIGENPNAETITMSVLRDGKQEDKTMARQFLEVKDPIRFKISETRSDGTKVGFVRILEFNALVKTKLEDALAKLEAEGANAYVIDLRMNTGGAFQSAVEIASLFMQDKVATYVVDSSGAEIPFQTTKTRLAIDAQDPVAVWVDGTSASASEVFAGALHDNCRAAIMGDKSFGKGLIQAVYGLKNGAGLVLTVARYVTPGGNEIQGIGITPDIKGGVPLPIPGISADTSKVDFKEVAKRLSPEMCTVPDFKGPAAAAAAAAAAQAS
ncbi:CtpA-like serine protease [Seminavis robusta]|uniref:CtpA-like serine protease n=1 Tax=Seminavis robusta TaxID=568900 RepID=A0A9N8DH78_9STRA|nr:CtpA-like serine protease [Seminavis robusta]|eukprot:Sro143_g066760.1 CtpA-like serine protease (503) ;mRNA; r:90230-91860